MEDLGYKNPLTKKVSLNKERVLYWLKNGAQPSDTVHNLFVAEKIIEGKKIKITNISGKKQAEIAEAAKKAAAPAEAPKEESKPVEEPKAEGEAKPEEPKA